MFHPHLSSAARPPFETQEVGDAMTAPRSATTRSRVTWALVLTISVGAGCASAPPPGPPPSPPTADTLTGVRRIVVAAAGESRFSAGTSSSGPGREFNEVMKWLPYKEILVPMAHALYWGVTWLVDNSRASSLVPADVAPAAVVADAFARTLQDSGPFDQITAMAGEPVGDARRNADAIVRLAVPSWGLMGIREGDPQMAAAFADVRAQIVLRETGVVLWQHEEDVTHPERLPLQALRGDRALTREQLLAVLERAGRRLANELVYAQGRP